MEGLRRRKLSCNCERPASLNRSGLERWSTRFTARRGPRRRLPSARRRRSARPSAPPSVRRCSAPRTGPTRRSASSRRPLTNFPRRASLPSPFPACCLKIRVFLKMFHFLIRGSAGRQPHHPSPDVLLYHLHCFSHMNRPAMWECLSLCVGGITVRYGREA